MELAVDRQMPESAEARITRYLTWASEAMRSASWARNPDLRQAHMAIANSWMQLAEDALRRVARA